MIVEETVRGKIEAADRPEPCDVRLCDFDGAKFRVFVDAEAPTIVYVSIFVRCYADLYDNGAAEMIANVYEGLFTEEAEEGFDLTLCFDIANLPDDPEVLISKCCQLKRNLMAAPFEQAFMAVQQKTTPPPPCSLPFRKDEWIYIFPAANKVTVFYSVSFDDANEQAIARVFLQEFAEAKQRVKNGPPVSFKFDPPTELQSMDVTLPESHVGFLSFIIFESHVRNQERLVNSATLLQSFRSYLHYHLKASKSYLATRMRTRVASLLKTLKEAKPKGPSKGKKNAKGKTFVRK
jgi:actin related protein 2/3 complex, subunit 2